MVAAAAVVVGAALRLLGLGRPVLDFDETFTAVAARMPIDRLLTFLRHADAHPPLDYLLRHPMAVAGAGDGALRLPSAILSVATLVVFAIWMRRRGRLGLIAVGMMAVAAFQITYARDARMYAGMTLVGVTAGWAADEWLRSPRRAWAAAAGAAVLVGLFLHASALVMAAGLLLIPGLRRDRPAWEWRASMALAGAAWAVTWGPSFLDQAGNAHSSWIPHTSPDYLARTLNELVSSYAVTRFVVVAAMLAGCALLARSDRTTARLLACCFALPVVLAAAIGVKQHFLLPRTLAFLSWVPLLGLAALVDAAWQRWSLLGVAAAVCVGVLLLPSTVDAVRPRPPATAAVLARVRHLARPGDVVAIHPRFLAPLTHWYLSVRRPGIERGFRVGGPNTDAMLLGAGPWSGRVWLVEPVTYTTPPTGLTPCAPTWSEDGYRLLCLTRTSS